MIWVIGIMAAVIFSLFIVVVAMAAYTKDLEKTIREKAPLDPVTLKRL